MRGGVGTVPGASGALNRGERCARLMSEIESKSQFGCAVVSAWGKESNVACEGWNGAC